MTFPPLVVSGQVISAAHINLIRNTLVAMYGEQYSWAADVTANNKNISGINSLGAAVGAFSGGVSAASATLTGTLSAATVTSSGAVNGASAAITGAITAGSLTSSGAVSGGNVTASGSAFVAGVIRFTGAPNKYIENQSEHLAFYKVSSPTNQLSYYWRRSADGLAGGASQFEMMSLHDTGGLTVSGTGATQVHLTSTGVSDVGFRITDGSRAWKMGVNVGGSGSGKLTFYNLSASVPLISMGDLDVNIYGTQISIKNALPGPYADNAGAIAAGLAQGRLYRRTVTGGVAIDQVQ